MENIKVSVITPTFNDEKRLSKVIESVLNQNYPKEDFQFIIVDNNSEDHTKEVVEKYEKVIYLFENKIQSSYSARNKGILKSKGDILAFIDSDCTADKNWLKNALKEFDNKSVGLQAGSIIFKYKEEKPNIYEYIDSIRFLRQEEYVRDGFGVTANLFVRKEIFNNLGLFDSSLKSGGDYQFCKKAKDNGYKIFYNNNAVVCHSARSTLSELIKKTIRISKGQRKLKKDGFLKRNCTTWQLLRPKYNLPHNEHWNNFSLSSKLKIIIIFNLLHYLNVLIKGL